MFFFVKSGFCSLFCRFFRSFDFFFVTLPQETEAMRLESDFADGIRGLQVAGAKTLRPKAVVKYVQE